MILILEEEVYFTNFEQPCEESTSKEHTTGHLSRFGVVNLN